MAKRYLFPTTTDGNGESGLRRGTPVLSAVQITKDLKSYAAAAETWRDFSMHSFCSGGAISQALAEETLAFIMQWAFW